MFIDVWGIIGLVVFGWILGWLTLIVGLAAVIEMEYRKQGEARIEELKESKGYAQIKNPLTNKWTLVDRDSGKIVTYSRTKFEGIPIHKSNG